MEDELKEIINDLYINQQKLINKIIDNNEIIKKIDIDIEELLILKRNYDLTSKKIICNLKKREIDLIQKINNQEMIIQEKRNKYNSLLE